MSGTLPARTVLIQYSKSVHEQNPLSVFLRKKYVAYVVLIEEVFSHIDCVVVRVVDVHTEPFRLQLVHHFDLLFDKGSSCRADTEVNGALLLPQLLLGLQVDHVRGHRTAIDGH